MARRGAQCGGAVVGGVDVVLAGAQVDPQRPEDLRPVNAVLGGTV
jgi:hypothetical protein